MISKILKSIINAPGIRQTLQRTCQSYVELRPGVIRLGLEQKFIEDRARIPQDQLDLEEAFLGKDIEALRKLAELIKHEEMIVVEVGSWKGMSTSVLAKVASEHNGKVFAIDHWEGDDTTWCGEIAKQYDVYSIFRKNMELLGLWKVVHPMVTDSKTASQVFADEVADLVFLDANHRYEYITKDIEMWLPKLKAGGILCGHDCEGYYTSYSKKMQRTIDENLIEDYVSGVHPGVIRALYEHFEDNYLIVSGSLVWYYIKEAKNK